MLDPRFHRTTTSATQGDDARSPLAELYKRFDAVATGRAPAGGVDLHQVILDRLAANRVRAEAAGWTACRLERDGGMGRLRMVGVAPSADDGRRSIVPDWTAAAAEGASPRPPHIVRG